MQTVDVKEQNVYVLRAILMRAGFEFFTPKCVWVYIKWFPLPKKIFMMPIFVCGKITKYFFPCDWWEEDP
jgi:hypothetical protein